MPFLKNINSKLTQLAKKAGFKNSVDGVCAGYSAILAWEQLEKINNFPAQRDITTEKFLQIIIAETEKNALLFETYLAYIGANYEIIKALEAQKTITLERFVLNLQQKNIADEPWQFCAIDDLTTVDIQKGKLIFTTAKLDDLVAKIMRAFYSSKEACDDRFFSLNYLSLKDHNLNNISLQHKNQTLIYQLQIFHNQIISTKHISKHDASGYSPLCLASHRGLQAQINMHMARIAISKVEKAKHYCIGLRCMVREH